MGDVFSDAILPVTYNFECLRCGETFNVHFGEILKSHLVSCPNCKSVMNDEAASLLQLAVKSIDDALNCLKKDNFSQGYLSCSDKTKESTGFTFAIKWPDTKLLPNSDGDNFKPIPRF